MKFNQFNQLLFAPEPEGGGGGGGGGGPTGGAGPGGAGGEGGAGGGTGGGEPPKPLIGDDFSFSDDWQTRVGDEAKGLTFKSLKDMAKSANEATATINRLTQENDTLKKGSGAPADIPKDTSGYIAKLALPDEKSLPEGVFLPKEMVEAAAQYGIANNIDPAITAKFVAFQIEQAGKEHQNFKTEEFARVENAKVAIKKAVGDTNYDVTISNAKAAHDLLGLNLDPTDLISNPTLVTSLAKLHEKISPGTLKELNLSTEGQTAEGKLQQARNILNDENNPLNKAFYDSSHPQHKQANDEYNRLIAESAAGR